MTAPNDTTPILEALAWLRDHTRLTKAEYEALSVPPPVAVRTLGDLKVVVGRGEIEEKLARKLGQVLG
jgi:hypothetical protein